MTTGSTQHSSESKEPLAAELVRDAQQGEHDILKGLVLSTAKAARIAEKEYFDADPDSDTEECKAFVEAQQRADEAIDRLIAFEGQAK